MGCFASLFNLLACRFASILVGKSESGFLFPFFNCRPTVQVLGLLLSTVNIGSVPPLSVCSVFVLMVGAGGSLFGFLDGLGVFIGGMSLGGLFTWVKRDVV